MAIGRKTGGGSRKGRPNKVTADLRSMILAALDGVGGQEYLQQQAAANPAAFLTLIGKVLPMTMNHNLREGFADKLAKARERTSGGE
jgi:hypothetical protein